MSPEVPAPMPARFATSPRPQRLAGVLLVTLLAACSGTPSTGPLGSLAPGASVAATSASAVPSEEPPILPTSSPSTPVPSAPLATPSPTPRPAVWSKPVAVNGLEDCGPIALAVDDSHGYHIAVDCRRTADSSEVRYATSSDGLTWTTTRFAPPANRLEMDSQIAFDGSMLYVAYSRLAPVEGGCGDRGLEDVGVYVRSRELPSGAWSAPRQIGITRDELQAFRVANGRIYATVWNDASLKTSFETVPVGGGATTRVVLASRILSTSLRVGDDGVARVAFDDPKGIRFGTVDASGLHASVIPSTVRGHHPNLVLAPGNVAFMLWTRNDLYGGCAGPEPPPDNGTYFSTNAGGSWHTERVSSSLGEKSLTVEPGTGIVHAIVGVEDGIALYDRASDATWIHETLGSGGFSSPVTRQDAASGRLVVAYVHVTFDENTPDQVEIMTKG